MSEFYVYAYRIDGQMAYIGKGKGKRAWVHLRDAKNAIFRLRIANANRVTVRIIKAGLTEAEAFQLERRCIRKWDQTLCNIAQGIYSSDEAVWHDCLHDLQNNVISYGETIKRKSRSLMNMETGQMAEQDSMELRVRNLAWLRRQYRLIMRAIEKQHPSLIA